ncbi:MAG: cytochrome c biogenesis protein CcsA [Peptococcaceae bacterium]|nr:cytochrome c biogenesis protein CcsA [Peptococcaceae bacterium]
MIVLWIAAILTLAAFVANLVHVFDYHKQKRASQALRKTTQSRDTASQSPKTKTKTLAPKIEEPNNQVAETRAKVLYGLSVAAIAAAAAILWIILLTDQFTYQYAAQYSSADLSILFKITAFWAGQEGSFLLWVLLHGLIGLMIYNRKDIAPGAKTVFSFVQLCLLIILLVKDPFVQTAAPLVARGLNPLLQNFWMISHPPFLFLGYAALAVPFALAVGSLLDGEYKSWIKKALPFSLFAWAFLGLGNFLGAYWAYEVLGWGGYWGWDPVENSSLIPWLVCGGLVHFMLLALRKPNLVKPSYIAAISAFGLALYGTFLTRSGILQSFSAHSFGQSNLTRNLLASVIFPLVGAAFIILIVKWKKLPSPREEDPILTRGFMTYAGALVLCLFALVVLMGTSIPLITGIIGESSNVTTSYYNSSGLLSTLALLAILLLSVLFPWVRPAKAEVAEIEEAGPALYIKIIAASVGAIVFAGVGFLFGINQGPVMTVLVLLGLAAAGAVFALSILSFSKDFGRGMNRAAVVTHIGLSVLVAGVLYSSACMERVAPVTFEAGEEKTVLGHQVTFLGGERLDDPTGYSQRFLVDNKTVEINSRYYEVYGFEHKPTIRWSLLGDFYIAPNVVDVAASIDYVLPMGSPVVIDIGGEKIELTLKDFLMPDMESGDSMLAFYVDVVYGDTREEIVLNRVRSEIGMTTDTVVVGKYKLTLNRMNIIEGAISVLIYEVNQTQDEAIEEAWQRAFEEAITEAVSHVSVEVSTKPLIILVWLGTIIVSLGILWAALRRWGPSPFQDLHNKNRKRRR